MPPRRSAQPPPPPDIREFRTLAEIDTAIGKLQRRIADVDTLRAEGVNHADVRVTNIQHAIRDTIREVFGQESAQFDRHQYFKIKQITR